MRTVTATRYVTPLREGGSLPAIVEADDDGLYVLKFRGAGQGAKALVAEVVAGEIGRTLGLPVPEIVYVELDAVLGRNEPDSEIRALITTSAGLNVGLDYLPGSLAYNPAITRHVGAELASAVVWFDAYVTNIDRTPRNTNLLLWHKQLYLIDHGAALYFHHTWADALAKSRTPFPAIKEHVLLPEASRIREVGRELKPRLTADVLAGIVDLVPDEWLGGDPIFASAAAQRAAYVEYLVSRRAASDIWEEEAVRARAQLV